MIPRHRTGRLRACPLAGPEPSGPRAPEQTFHLWNVPGTAIWQVREAPSSRITFQEEEGEIVSFTREAAGAQKLVAMKVR